jgi:antibiotic biosynthesis monooxygenase (ABM) superfamily enzyme
VEVRVSRASSVIVHRVPPDGTERFLEWQRGITATTAEFPGYQATDIYPPADGQPEWVVIVHFDHPEALQRWLDSPSRAEWLAKLQGAEAGFQLKTLTSGFGAWFTGSLGQSKDALPPSWKMVLSVLLGLYPTVMLLTIFVGPHTKRLGLAADMLIGNALSVSLLQWAVMPVLQIVLGPWLRASGPQGKAVTIWGLVLVLFVLAGLMLFFRAVTG